MTKPLRDTILRDSFTMVDWTKYIGWYVEMCDFEDSKLKRQSFAMTYTSIDDDYDCSVKVNFEI